MIDVRSPLTLGNSFRFPLQTPRSRQEVLIGALWLLVPPFGWLMNMGHRIQMVHNMHHGRPTWPAWTDSTALLKHGLITCLGMAYYGAPGVALVAVGLWKASAWMMIVGGVLWLAAVVAIPGYMSHYCRAFDVREIFNPIRALSRVAEGGWAYWKAWGIVLCALVTSFVGLLGLGVFFLATSVWFWQVAGFSFATVFTQRFELDDP